MMMFPYFVSGNLHSIDFKALGYEMQTEEVLHFLSSHLNQIQGKKIRKRKNQLVFKTKHSLVNFTYVVSLKIEKTEQINIHYQFKTNELQKILLALLLFIAFFSHLDISSFLSFSFLICSIFYGLNVWFIHSVVRRWIRKMPIFSLEEKTKSSINRNQCPACNAIFDVYDLTCKSCGFNLEPYRLILPFNITKYEHKTIVYHYKKTCRG